MQNIQSSTQINLSKLFRTKFKEEISKINWTCKKPTDYDLKEWIDNSIIYVRINLR